jgi:hypothetical protein
MVGLIVALLSVLLPFVHLGVRSEDATIRKVCDVLLLLPSDMGSSRLGPTTCAAALAF